MDAYENADANRPHEVWTYLFGRHLTDRVDTHSYRLEGVLCGNQGVAELDLLEDVPQKLGWSDNIRDNIEGGVQLSWRDKGDTGPRWCQEDQMKIAKWNVLQKRRDAMISRHQSAAAEME